jgi:hypothetical protein
MSKTRVWPEVWYSRRMTKGPDRHSEDKTAPQQRFLSLFLRSEREVFRSVATLVLMSLTRKLLCSKSHLALEKVRFVRSNPANTAHECQSSRRSSHEIAPLLFKK